MSVNEVIIISENTHDETSVIEVMNVAPVLVLESMEDQTNITAVEVIEAILDPNPEDDQHGTAEINDYVVAEPGGEMVSELSAEQSNQQMTSELHGTEDHVAAAIDAQQHSDEAVAAGDYATAAHAREDAENEAWEAGNGDMLHGSSSAELDLAAHQQEEAQQFEAQESRDAQAGDYEAAREDADHAGDAAGWADYNAGGSDHTGQPDFEYDQESWAVWEHDSGEADHQLADAYAADGEFDNAAQYASNAMDHHAEADYHGEMGDHNNLVADHDASSDIATHDHASESYHEAEYSDNSSDS